MFALNTCDSVWFTKNAPTMTIAFESGSSVMIFKGYLRCPSLSFVPILAIVAAWAYVAGKRADAMRGPEAIEHTHVFGHGGQTQVQALPSPTPTVTIEHPKEPSSLAMGAIPWEVSKKDRAKVPKIRKRSRVESE